MISFNLMHILINYNLKSDILHNTIYIGLYLTKFLDIYELKFPIYLKDKRCNQSSSDVQ